ncbi:ABC transporter ATP-binding protein [Celeribacter halophilus]|uniref:ABC transporter ATP-binding protein n=1 Tax=Celeribacter halophilus TaxID=576117 RepID=UPI003A8FA4D3
MSISAETQLEVTGLSSGYGGITVLNNLGFEISKGEFVGILGHNGMGKTTLMRSLIGAVPARLGSITFLGTDITGFPPHKRNQLGIGYVPQGREIIKGLSVRENLLLGQAAHPGPSEYNTVLDLFPELVELLDRPASRLSGGQQQLLALGRCLMGKPKLLLLDEPTEGIQPSIVSDIGKTLSQLCDELGLTIVVVEQNLDFLCRLVNRNIILRGGKVIADLQGPDARDRALIESHLSLAH